MARSVVAITGASSGIGEVFARKLAPEHDLILIARRRDRLEALAAELGSSFGCRSRVVEADLASDEGLETAAKAISGEPDLVLLVNNAGFGSKGRFWEKAYQAEETMYRVHVMATLRLTHAALQDMVRKDRGAIINVASVAAFVRNAGSVSYGATKTWMTAFTEGLYLELKSIESNVAVQALCPGFTYSEFHDAMGVDRLRMAPRSFWMRAEDVVDASLAGLARGQLIVVPGWRYRLLTAFLSALPTSLRIRVEALSGRARSRQLTSSGGRTEIGPPKAGEEA
jgi:short-subunit dehydrogenase